METGIIKHIVTTRGFCFVRRPDETEVFMHASALPKGTFTSLVAGDQVRIVHCGLDEHGRVSITRAEPA